MRRIKKFYETHIDDVVQKDYISPDELESQLDSALQLNDFEASTKLLRSIKTEYPYIKEQSPYKEIYESFLKKWYNKFRVELDLYQTEKFNEDVDYTVQKDYISIDELREQLTAAIKINNFEASTKMFRSIKNDYPYVKTTEPYKSLYSDYISKWHNKFKTDLEYYRPENGISESVSYLPDDIFKWIKSEFGTKDCKITKISQNDKELKVEVNYSSPIISKGFSDRTYANIIINVNDYADDYDYNVSINGKYGKYGQSKTDLSKESWKDTKNISVKDDELSFSELKIFIKNNIKNIIS